MTQQLLPFVDFAPAELQRHRQDKSDRRRAHAAQYRGHFGITFEARVQQSEDENNHGAGNCHTGHRGNRPGDAAQTAADDYAYIGRDQPRDGLSNLQSRQEVIVVKPFLKRAVAP